METVVHRIRDLSGSDRSAAEQLVGHALRENEQLVIQVVNLDSTAPATQQPGSPASGVPEWWNIYEGLSDERIEELDQAIRQRANLTRFVE
jgi:hypothetical protein